MKDKMNNTDFITAVSQETGEAFSQKEVRDVLRAAANVVLNNLKNGIETAVFEGMVVYPATYKGEKEILFPRARFGRYFKTLA